MIHSDLKPENILYKDSRKKDLKIIDFGSGSFTSRQGYSYVQSRYYRAPEVVLNINNPPQYSAYGCPIDMWSLGCIVGELYSGVPVFPGIDENELLEIMDLLVGSIPAEMVESGKKRDKLFYQGANGTWKVRKSPNSRVQNVVKNQISLEQIIFKSSQTVNLSQLTTDQANLIDFIKKCFLYKPFERMTCDEALKHPFLKNVV